MSRECDVQMRAECHLDERSNQRLELAQSRSRRRACHLEEFCVVCFDIVAVVDDWRARRVCVGWPIVAQKIIYRLLFIQRVAALFNELYVNPQEFTHASEAIIESNDKL